METAEQNRMLVQVGRGTPMGALLRRYWQVIGTTEDLQKGYTKRVRLFGEDLVLFRDRSGKLGLVAEKCPHRRASLAYGMPTERGLRCPYHGWEFDASGKCLEQPNEKDNPAFRERVGISGYPVEELGGLYWAYLGPLPAPLLPRFDGFVAQGTIRIIGKALLPVNWLQVMENSVDPIHTEWLHGHHYEFIKEQEGIKLPISAKHDKIDFREFEFGITKHRLLVGHSEESDDWKVGHPLVFPNMLAVGNGDAHSRTFMFQIRVPVDDEHTMHYWYYAYLPPAGIPVPSHLLERAHVHEVPYRDENGDFIVDFVDGEDIMAWISQGTIADRSEENLGASDVGLVMYRRMLKREMAKVAAGEDPMGTVRDAARNVCIELPNEKNKHHFTEGFDKMMLRTQARYSPIAQEFSAVYKRAILAKAA